MQYNAPNSMYVFQKFVRGWHYGPILVLRLSTWPPTLQKSLMRVFPLPMLNFISHKGNSRTYNIN